MSAPFVGLPTTREARCSFAPDLGSPGCDLDPTTHIAVRSSAWGVVALPSCDRHAPIARATGEVLGEHPHQPTCLVTDCWPGLYERTDRP